MLGSPTTTQPRPALGIDDVREDAITMARAQLANLWDFSSATPPIPAHVNTPWSMMTYAMIMAGAAYDSVIEEDNRDAHATTLLRTELNAYLRQVLIQCLVVYQVETYRSSKPALVSWLSLQFLARDRAVALLDKSNIDQRVVARLRPPLLGLYEEVRPLVERADGTMPPAVHP